MFGTSVSFIAFVARTASCFVTSSLIPWRLLQKTAPPSLPASYIHTYVHMHVPTTTTQLTLAEDYQRLKFSKKET